MVLFGAGLRWWVRRVLGISFQHGEVRSLYSDRVIRTVKSQVCDIPATATEVSDVMSVRLSAVRSFTLNVSCGHCGVSYIVVHHWL